MKIIEKETITITDNNYLLLGIDDNNTKYYLLDINTSNNIPRIGLVYCMYNYNVVDVIEYVEYIDRLKNITHSTLSTEDLTILTNILNHIKSLILSYRIVLNTNYGVKDIQPDTKKLTKEYNHDILTNYSKISNLFQ